MFTTTKQQAAGAFCNAMGAETIQKSAVSPKNQKSRRNILIIIFGIFFVGFIFSSCEKPIINDDPNAEKIAQLRADSTRLAYEVREVIKTAKEELSNIFYDYEIFEWYVELYLPSGVNNFPDTVQLYVWKAGSNLIDYPNSNYYSVYKNLKDKGNEYLSIVAKLQEIFPPKPEEEKSGTIGMLLWKISPDKVLTISGNGEMPNYEMPGQTVNTPWYPYRDKINKIVVTSGVTSIGENAFTRCVKATDISIGNDVKSIKERVFFNCMNLANVTIGNNVETIELDVFRGIFNLKKVTINVIIPPSLDIEGQHATHATKESTLFVPKGSLAAYENSMAWREAFGTIVEQ